jgi:acyl-CoA hydrolase
VDRHVRNDRRLARGMRQRRAGGHGRHRYSPVSTNEVVTLKAALNHVGTSSLEIGVKVLAEVPQTGEVRHACTAYLTYVHLGPDLRPRPCPPFVPETPSEQRRWREAVERRGRRLARVNQVKQGARQP